MAPLSKPGNTANTQAVVSILDAGAVALIFVAATYWAAHARSFAWLANLLVFATGIVFLACAVKLGMSAAARVRGAVSVRLRATPIYMIRSSPSHFRSTAIPASEACLPDIEGEWLSMGRDHARLKAYAQQIDNHRLSTKNVVDAAIAKFTTDRKTLVDQQTQILRLAFRAKSKIAFFDELPPLSVSVASLPEYARIALPDLDAVPAESTLNRRYVLLPGGVGAPLARLLAAPSTDNLIAVAIIAAAAAIHAKATISKAMRMLECARGEANVLYADARGLLDLLGRSHEEIVACSNRLKSAEIEIEGLLLSLENVSPATTLHLRSLGETDRGRVTRLWHWVLCAEAIHSRYAV